MKILSWFCVVASLFLVMGCQKAPQPPENAKATPSPSKSQANDESEVRTNLAKLSPADRKLAEQQRFCVVSNDSRLGSMGVPIKLMLKDQAVFLCCKGCVKAAQRDPDKTLATVKELRARSGAAPASKTEEKSEKKPASAVSGKVSQMRVPNGGIQPQTMVDGRGVVHMIYFSGEAKGGDVFYVHSKDGEHFSQPLRANSKPGSVIAIGNIRGAHLALGKGGRVHVAWMGSDRAEPRGPDKASPMLYTRLNDAGTAFEPERNIIRKAYGLDGGGSVAADEAGNVYVIWHAPEPGVRGEANRCVWVAHSTDEGKTFAAEKRANDDATGACGCCGMRGFTDKKGTLYVLYRSAGQVVHRDIYLLVSADRGDHFRGQKVHAWEVANCPMSSMAFTESAAGTVAAWETKGQVYCTHLAANTSKPEAPLAAPGKGEGRKHPVVAANAAGETILVWTEGMGWNRGGSVAWQVFDKAGKPTERHGRADGVPTWSVPAVFTRADGSFTIVY